MKGPASRIRNLVKNTSSNQLKSGDIVTLPHAHGGRAHRCRVHSEPRVLSPAAKNRNNADGESTLSKYRGMAHQKTGNRVSLPLRIAVSCEPTYMSPGSWGLRPHNRGLRTPHSRPQAMWQPGACKHERAQQAA
eukprot:6024616-Amphidinium_carterae.3